MNMVIHFMDMLYRKYRNSVFNVTRQKDNEMAK